MSKIRFEDIRKNKEINTYIEMGNETLGILGFTDHGLVHVLRTAELSSYILKSLGYDDRICELGAIAGYIHDIGNVINRVDHAQSGAAMAFNILSRLNFDPEEIALIISAIGNHDEATSSPVNEVAAALILADKSDVRRSRVRNTDKTTFDIHDRVNYAVEESELLVLKESGKIALKLKIDTDISSVMDYFEIFLNRMILCRHAAEYLGLEFELLINDLKLL